MAIVTKNIATLVDNGLNAEFEVDYDNATMLLEALRVVNPTSRDVLATAIRQDNGRLYSATFPAGQTTFISVPQSPTADRIAITLDAQGRIEGVEWAVRFAS